MKSNSQKNEKVFNTLLKRTGEATKGLNNAVVQINNSRAAIKTLQQDTIWVKLADWVSPLWVLLIASLLGFGVGWKIMSFRYDSLSEEHNSSINVVGRRILGWNVERYLKCQDDKNPKCTFWIVPPEER